MIMKTTTTLLLSAFAITVAAQTVQPEPYLMVDPISAEQQQPAKRDFPAESIIWSETFDSTVWHTAQANGVAIPANMPDGWSVVDNTENSFYWRWSTTGPRGRYTGGQGAAAYIPNENVRIKSTSDIGSGERGFMMLESDFYNTNDTGMGPDLINMDSYLQFGPINISQFEAVSIYFEQFHRFCCASYQTGIGPKLLVSSNGVNWVEFPVQSSGINITPKINPSSIKIPLTNTLQGFSSLYLRFHQKTHTHYFWEIDDIYLFVPYDIDSRLVYFWADYIETFRSPYLQPNGFFNYSNFKRYSGIPYFTPYSLVEDIIGSRALIQNQGKTAVDNVLVRTEIVKNNTLIFESSTTTINNINPYLVDSAEISYSFQIPRNESSLGEYGIKGIVEQQEQDQHPEDNLFSRSFHITKNLYGYTNPAFANTYTASQLPYTDTGCDGLGIIVKVDPTIGDKTLTGEFSQHIIKSVQVYIPSTITNQYTWDYGSIPLYATVCALIPSSPTNYNFDHSSLQRSDTVNINSELADTWVTIPFGSSGIPLITEHPEKRFAIFIRNAHCNPFSIGADKVTEPSQFSMVYFSWGVDIYYFTGDYGYAIQAIIEPQEGFSNTPTHFTIRNHADGNIFPAAGASVRIQNQTHTAGSEGTLTLDLVGGTHTYWVDYGSETRKGHVTVYGLEQTVAVNFGTVGIEKPTLSNEIKLYPNPAQNLLTVESSTEPLKMEITNLLGQTLKTVINPTASQTVDITGLATGVYVVTVVDRGNGRVSKMFVKQ
jgi:hypothetical protein